MGTGKSSCGRAIAQQLGYRLVDLDKEIETKYKMPISTMFKVHGEDWFRQKEKEMVAYWAHQKNVVISTGGGTAAERLRADRGGNGACGGAGDPRGDLSGSDSAGRGGSGG